MTGPATRSELNDLNRRARAALESEGFKAPETERDLCCEPECLSTLLLYLIQTSMDYTLIKFLDQNPNKHSASVQIDFNPPLKVTRATCAAGAVLENVALCLAIADDHERYLRGDYNT